MSFFFTKIKQKPKPAKMTSAGKSSKESLNRLGCKVCPLDKAKVCSPKMLPDLAETTDIYFLGESPNATDDKKGLPFASKTGKLLKSLIGNVDRCSFDNVIRDHNPTNVDRPSPTWVAMECCRNHIIKSIEETKPKMVVGLGITPLQWMLNSSDMVGLRGRIFAVTIGKHQCWFMPTYDPQYIIDTSFDKDNPLRSKLGHCLKFDIAKAIKAANNLGKPVIDTPQSARAAIQAFNGQSRTQLAPLLALISEARRAPQKAIDIEATNIRPYVAGAKLLSCALSFGGTNFAFAIDHPKAGWLPDEKKQIKAALKLLLTDDTRIIAHNAPCECEWMIHHIGKDSIRHDVWEDTMMQAHFLDERRGKRGGSDDEYQPNPYQALNFLINQYFGLAYKKLFKVDRKNMIAADLDETLIYNAADTKFTLKLYYHQFERLKENNLLEAYREAVMRQPAAALLQAAGILVDQQENKRIRVKLGNEIAAIEAKITAYPEVQQFIKDRKSFNPASGPDVLLLLKKYLNAGKHIINSEGKESSDKNSLSKITHPFARDLETYRNRSLLKSTFVDPFEFGKGEFIYPDGRIHQSLNTTFAETGRLTSDSPNGQNVPSRNDKWVRKQIVAPKGHVLVAFDYGQLEGCTGAMCSKDKVFVKALWEDYDMHMVWAERTAKLWPAYIGGAHNYTDKNVMEKFRGLIKNKMVFPAFFGAASTSIAGYLTSATGVEAPKHVIEKLFNDFWSEFSGVYSWQKQVMKGYYDLGYVSSLTGRRRHYPLTKSQAINYPIQSLGCDIVCDSMVTLSEESIRTGKEYLHPIMMIHDDLVYSIPEDPSILEPAIETIYKVMLTPPYDFVNVPLSVSVSVGKNWMGMDKIGKFWSHRDI